MTDKGDTFIFKPEEPEEKPAEKEKILRTDVDEFTIARKGREYEEEEKPSALPYIAAILGALVVIAVAFLIIFLTTDKDEEIPQNPVQNKEETTLQQESEEEEETAPVINSYNLGYNGGKIYELENGGYSVVFEVYNYSGNKTGTQKFYINADTVIKDQGSKIQLGAFVNFIENQAGEIVILDCTVNEDESTILTVTYSSSGYGEEEEEPSEEEAGEAPAEESPTEVVEPSDAEEPVVGPTGTPITEIPEV